MLAAGKRATDPRFTDASEYMVRGTDTFRLVTDHLGSVRLVVNTTTGSVAHRIDYDEFGVVTNDTNPGMQPFGFAGGLYVEAIPHLRRVSIVNSPSK